MNGTDVLRLQLTGSLNLIAERLEAMSDGEWNRRALPGTNKLGFILWHCARIVDWAVHSALQGAPEVADRKPWAHVFPRHAFYGAGIEASVADSVTEHVTRAQAAAYLTEVRKAVLEWFERQSDRTLDATTPLRDRQAARTGYFEPPVWAEVASLDGLPAWQILARPAVSHVRVHIGEYDVLLQALRTAERGVRA